MMKTVLTFSNVLMVTMLTVGLGPSAFAGEDSLAGTYRGVMLVEGEDIEFTVELQGQKGKYYQSEGFDKILVCEGPVVARAQDDSQMSLELSCNQWMGGWFGTKSLSVSLDILGKSADGQSLDVKMDSSLVGEVDAKLRKVDMTLTYANPKSYAQLSKFAFIVENVPGLSEGGVIVQLDASGRLVTDASRNLKVGTDTYTFEHDNQPKTGRWSLKNSLLTISLKDDEGKSVEMIYDISSIADKHVQLSADLGSALNDLGRQGFGDIVPVKVNGKSLQGRVITFSSGFPYFN